MRVQRSRSLYVLLLPALIWLLLIYGFPIVSTVYYSFMNVYGTRFVGLANFKLVTTSFAPTLLRTVIWTFGSVIPAMILGLVGALLYREQFAGRRVLMTLTLLPYCMPLIIVSTLWSIMYNPSYGLIDTFLLKVGIIQQPIVFLGHRLAMVSVIVARMWRAMPFAFLAYSAGLTSIPDELYAAASVDGANAFQQFFSITLPQLRSVTLTTGLVLTIWTTLVFDIIYAMTAGGPANATKILPIAIYQQFMNLGDLGTAGALVIYTVIFLMVFSYGYWRLIGGGEEE